MEFSKVYNKELKKKKKELKLFSLKSDKLCSPLYLV